MSKTGKHFYEFAEFRLDIGNRLLWRHDELVMIQPQVWETLLLLVEQSGKVVTPDEFKQRLRPDSAFDSANLAQNIHLARLAIGENGKKFIRNFAKNGYQFTVPVREVWEDEAPSAISASLSPPDLVTLQTNDEPRRPPPRQLSPPKKKTAARWRFLSSLTAAAVLLLMGWGAWLLYKYVTVPTAITSLAVLPFRPLDAGQHDESLESGLADTLITRLSGQAQVQVRPTSAVLPYKKSDLASTVIGRELKVDAVLEGNVQRAGNRVRVTTQLLRVADGRLLWGKQYDEEWQSVFVVQDQISEQIADALTLKLTTAQQRRLTKHYTDNHEAYQAYIKGRYLWNQRTPTSLREAIRSFHEAVDLDHNYALAYAGLADALSLLANYTFVSAHELYPQASEAARQAIALDETLAEGHTALAYVQTVYEWKWKEAEASYQRALALSPNYATAHQWHGNYLTAVGRHDEAVTEVRRALELDPLSLIVQSDLALTYYFKRDYQEAIKQCQQVIEMDRNFGQAYYYLYPSYLAQGNYDQAIAAYLNLGKLNGRSDADLTAFRQAYEASGWPGVMGRLLQELSARDNPAAVANSLALCYAEVGEKEKALDWLEKAYEARASGIMHLKVSPRLDSLRGETRFQELLRKIGLAN